MNLQAVRRFFLLEPAKADQSAAKKNALDLGSPPVVVVDLPGAVDIGIDGRLVIGLGQSDSFGVLRTSFDP